MRHCVSKVKLNRKQGNRKALIMNLARSLLLHGKIHSTKAKIAACRPFAEKMITLMKKGDLASIRRLVGVFRSKEYVKEVSQKISEMYKDRNGGYTRTVKIGYRQGDGAPISVIELV
ncbi:50S ribosomal protein L17 [Candidatus Cytomitobacter indipagum]|uniref:50S ribosomal protein L17 n=1 Tax=Candidatus Cytomitobacter indipagum TaxID=2601575 RepID=A0A5C0UEW7_9PROT|nr:50S ribosomal protein L17 [Candidatus Cytomitobacter indipagum]QEK38250.1 50S ribosomal protein L17 [Candidatus Cytomitobacter indipagum]